MASKNIMTALMAAFAMAAGVAGASAQQGPNRIFIHDTDGIVKGHVADRLDKITFDRVDGAVAADISISKVTTEKLTLSVKRTAACRSFRIAVATEAMCRSQLATDLAKIRFIDMYGTEPLGEDFDNGELSGVTLDAGSDYRVLTVGVDKFGVECDVREAKFTTPAPGVQGNPTVEASTVSAEMYGFSVNFKPNADVSAYYVMSSEKGEMEKQYDQWASMFGFTNINMMIADWGLEKRGEATVDWNDMTPNTDYEVFIAIKDKKGNYAPHRVYDIKTAPKGGTGVAKVTITPGDYCMSASEDGPQKTQEMKFTPNDQTWEYRFNVVLKSLYDKDPEGYKADLCSDPEMPMVGWFWFEEMENDYFIDENVEIMAIAAGKNVNGEWGPVTELAYTTPSECEGWDYTLPARARALAQRQQARPADRTPGRLPHLQRAGLRLTHR